MSAKRTRKTSARRSASLVGCYAWLGVRVICPSAPKYARRGYRGKGWIGTVCEDLVDKVNVTYSNGARRVWHKSHLSRLSSPNEKDEQRAGARAPTSKKKD